MKMEKKVVFFRKSKETLLGIICIAQESYIKKSTLNDLSNIYIQELEKIVPTSIFLNNEQYDYKIQDLNKKLIEILTINFIEELRSNKIYAKFIYLNHNPNIFESYRYKKTKCDSTSVILYNTNKDYDKM